MSSFVRRSKDPEIWHIIHSAILDHTNTIPFEDYLIIICSIPISPPLASRDVWKVLRFYTKQNLGEIKSQNSYWLGQIIMSLRKAGMFDKIE